MVCDYRFEFSYICNAIKFEISFADRNVTEVSGIHITGYSNADVKSLVIQGQNCLFLPLNIGSHFPDLKRLSITKSNVQHLMSGDLDGLDKLQELDLSKNPIEQIGHDFFLGKSQISKIVFNYCHLKKIDVQAFDPLVSLSFAYFNYNKCIDMIAFDKIEIRMLKQTIRKACQGTLQVLKPKHSKVCEKNPSKSYLSISITTIIILFAVIAAVLSALLIRIHKTIFKGDWSAMRRHLS